jgi:hypothetical protein
LCRDLPLLIADLTLNLPDKGWLTFGLKDSTSSLSN